MRTVTRAGIVTGAIVLALLLASAVSAIATGAPSGGTSSQRPNVVYSDPTTSSPIALSSDNAFVWSVNPDDDSVSVIRADIDLEIQRFHVGQEPQSVALDPNNRYAFVANAADNSVSVISITTYITPGIINGFVAQTFRTGAEPWNIVISPDGKRVYVANSGQDTISVIRADAFPPSLIGSVTLDDGACNVGDANRHFQPRGLAVTVDSTKLFVTRFLSFVKSGSTQGLDIGKEGVVCRLDIDTSAATIGASVTFSTSITLSPQDSGFNGEQAYPNQMQSIVIRGDKAYLPNIASAPAAPLRFNADTHAFVNRIDGVTGGSQSDGGAINLHLGARVPEAGKTKLFFANPWAMAFTNQASTGNAYVVSAASDLLVKLNVDASGNLTFTNGVSTTRYIDLNDPANVITTTRNTGKNPLGIVIRNLGPGNNKAYVMNYVSRNVSVVNLDADAVVSVVNLTNLPAPGTSDEQLQVGREIFFSSRGNFDRPAGTTVTTTNRLSSDGWQACSSCHFAGLTDGNIWAFAAGPRKSVPLNGTFSPNNPGDQRLLNYSAIFDEVEDFEINIRNVSGPGALTIPINGSTFDPNHGLLISDTGDINTAPLVVNALTKANGGRPQLSVTLPGSAAHWPALTALKEWVRFGIRTPNGALTTSELTSGGGSTTGGLNPSDVAQGRRLFFQQGCQVCHGGTKWSVSSKDFTSPPASSEIATENPPITTTVNTQYLPRFLANINSFNLNVTGAGNPITGTPSIGAIEKAATGQDGLGKDYNADGIGAGFNIPSLLGIWQLPPYYHNGACETLNCVVADVQHRTANFTVPDRLSNPANQAKVVAFLRSLDAQTVFPTDLRIDRHDIFFDPPTIFRNTPVVVGANVSLFGTRADLNDISDTLKVKFTINGPAGAIFTSEVPLPAFTQDFGQATVTTTWNVPDTTGLARVTVEVDSTDVFAEANESDNQATRNVLVRNPPPDTTPPQVTKTRISDDTPFDENDPIVTTPNVKVLIVATDPPSPPNTSGLDSYCIVRYFYDVVTRRWVESLCAFTPLPPPDASNGDVFTYTVDATIPPFEGTAYAFTWVKDAAGNISRTPGFDVVSFIPATPININRNDVRLFRISTVPNQVLTFTFPIGFGDVDVSVFDNVTTNANRIAVSANNGAITETVSFTNTFGANRNFQIEVRAVVNSRFSITDTASTSLLNLMGLPAGPIAAPSKDDPAATPLIAGPPALQTAIGGEASSVYLPLVMK
jgi:DNA-binding beta-propeller fold protein YncE